MGARAIVTVLTVSLVSGSDSVVLVVLVLGYSPGWVLRQALTVEPRLDLSSPCTPG